MGYAAEKYCSDRAEFLRWEAQQTRKYEYLAGDVYAMTGARQSHVLVSGNVYALLKAHLRGTSCRAYMADMQVDIAAADAVFYPDVVVTCHPDDLIAERSLCQPVVIVEVLSESTAAFDRGDKFAAYRQLTSLQDYVLIIPEQRRLEVFRRTAEGDWLLAARDSERALILPSLGFEATLEAVFEDLDSRGWPLPG